MSTSQNEIEFLKTQVRSLLVIVAALATEINLKPEKLTAFADKVTADVAEPKRTEVRENIRHLLASYKA